MSFTDSGATDVGRKKKFGEERTEGGILEKA
jgi:hypothetical protein